MKTKLSLLVIGGALLLVGCYVEQPRGYNHGPAMEASYAYVYYPDAEVYYEPHRHVYFWADGGAWRSGPRVPANYVLRSRVTVNLNSPEPYRYHDEVRAKHPRHPEAKPQERGPQGRDNR